MWQPIESAPKDGTEFFACYSPEFDPVTDVIRWEDGAWWTDGDDWLQLLGHPPKTHSLWEYWHPLPDLPPPPTLDKEKSGG